MDKQFFENCTGSNKTNFMKTYLIKVSLLDPYPKENHYRATASNMSAAVSRAMKDWRKDYKGRKIKQLTIKVEML